MHFFLIIYIQKKIANFAEFFIAIFKRRLTYKFPILNYFSMKSRILDLHTYHITHISILRHTNAFEAI